MNLNPFFSPPLVGLDIQTDGIYLVQLKKSRGAFHLAWLSKWPLPPGIVLEDQVDDWPRLIAYLTEAVAAHQLQGCRVAMSMPARGVRMGHLSLPVGLSETEIETEIKTKMRRDLPGMKGTVWVDFTVLSESEEGYLDVAFTAAREESIARYRECANTAGFNLVTLDVDTYALARAVKYALPKEIATTAIMYMANSYALLLGINQREVLFEHYLAKQSDEALTAAVKRHLQQHASLHPHLQRMPLVLCGQEALPTLLIDNHSLMPLTHPFMSMKYSQNFDVSLLNDLERYWIACGLAMRRV